MGNTLMMRYAASRGNRNESDGGMRNEMNNRDMRMPDMNYGEMRGMNYDRGDGGSMQQPNQYTTRNEYDGGAESRYRGRDGRWKAGTRRSEYDGGMQNNGSYGAESRRMGGDDDEEEGRKYKIELLPQNVVEWPYSSPEDANDGNYRSSRQIGFGAMNTMGGHDMQERQHNHASHEDMEPMEFDRETAEHWVRSMRNEDKAHPVGGKWSPDMLKPLAQKYGIPTEGKKFWELYAMTNAMYSDYGEVARKFGITSPEFYVCMAKAWMEDKDAEPDKTALYYEYIVKKEGHSPMAA